MSKPTMSDEPFDFEIGRVISQALPTGPPAIHLASYALALSGKRDVGFERGPWMVEVTEGPDGSRTFNIHHNGEHVFRIDGPAATVLYYLPTD